MANAWTPYYVPEVGRITGNDTDYFECTLVSGKLSDGVTLNRRSFLGTQFYMETWFRLDPLDLPLNGYIFDLFTLEEDFGVDGWMPRLGMSISNTFLRIYVDFYIEDIHYDFIHSREHWHHVGISYLRLHE